jgi:hypothetical protein
MWLVVDLLLVGVFAVIGRLSHYGTLTLGALLVLPRVGARARR